MSTASVSSAVVFDYVTIGELAETTTQLLALTLQSDLRCSGNLVQAEQMILLQARSYLGRAREGFALSVRRDQVHQDQEMRYILRRFMYDWTALSAQIGLAPAGVDYTVEPAVDRVGNQVLSYAMAVAALGLLPKMPPDQITYPESYTTQPTYADIPAPSSPGETLYRIEEMEETIGRMAVTDPQELAQRAWGSVRRTYGFFETCAWLARKHAPRFNARLAPPMVTAF